MKEERLLRCGHCGWSFDWDGKLTVLDCEVCEKPLRVLSQIVSTGVLSSDDWSEFDEDELREGEAEATVVELPGTAVSQEPLAPGEVEAQELLSENDLSLVFDDEEDVAQRLFLPPDDRKFVHQNISRPPNMWGFYREEQEGPILDEASFGEWVNWFGDLVVEGRRSRPHPERREEKVQTQFVVSSTYKNPIPLKTMPAPFLALSRTMAWYFHRVKDQERQIVALKNELAHEKESQETKKGYKRALKSFFEDPGESKFSSFTSEVTHKIKKPLPANIKVGGFMEFSTPQGPAVGIVTAIRLGAVGEDNKIDLRSMNAAEQRAFEKYQRSAQKKIQAYESYQKTIQEHLEGQKFVPSQVVESSFAIETSEFVPVEKKITGTATLIAAGPSVSAESLARSTGPEITTFRLTIRMLPGSLRNFEPAFHALGEKTLSEWSKLIHKMESKGESSSLISAKKNYLELARVICDKTIDWAESKGWMEVGKVARRHSRSLLGKIRAAEQWAKEQRKSPIEKKFDQDGSRIPQYVLDHKLHKAEHPPERWISIARSIGGDAIDTSQRFTLEDRIRRAEASVYLLNRVVKWGKEHGDGAVVGEAKKWLSFCVSTWGELTEEEKLQKKRKPKRFA